MEKSNSQNSETVLRPPIVAILGHVDHGKTSLLDKIRNTNLTAREAGGITQSIGAWQVEISRKKATKDDSTHKITFIDTPGHAAFEGMRSRGVKIADLVVLVIAADDGIMPQTKQSIEFLRGGSPSQASLIKDSKTPFLVAITKTDLQTAQIDKVKNQLLEQEIVPEEYGGEVVVLPVSSKTGQGIDDLLEMIGLMSEMHNISGNPKGKLEAYILEAQKDPRRGVVVSVVVKNGTLKVGDNISAGEINGKVRGLFDEARRPIKEIGLSGSAEIIGFAALPQVGSQVSLQGEKLEESKESVKSLNITEGFPIILKADTSGSLEAILGQLKDDVGIVTSGLGELVESDVATAAATGATIVGFNIKISKEVQRFADEEKVNIYTYKIIYELLQDIERWIKEAAEKGREKILGIAEVIARFPHSKIEFIAGCKILEGRFTKSDKVRLKRGEETLGQVKIGSLKKQKVEVSKVEKGDECGILFNPQFDFQVGDVLESYQ